MVADGLQRVPTEAPPRHFSPFSQAAVRCLAVLQATRGRYPKRRLAAALAAVNGVAAAATVWGSNNGAAVGRNGAGRRRAKAQRTALI